MKLVWEVKGIIKKELDITDWSEAAIAAYEDELQKLWENKVITFRIKE